MHPTLLKEAGLAKPWPGCSALPEPLLSPESSGSGDHLIVYSSDGLTEMGCGQTARDRDCLLFAFVPLGSCEVGGELIL